MVTLTAVRPPARFGGLKIKGNLLVILKKNQNLMKVGLMVVFCDAFKFF